MIAPKLRMIAVPNGSGKSTLTEFSRKDKNLPLGLYLNADELEKKLELTKLLDFTEYVLSILNADVNIFIEDHH